MHAVAVLAGGLGTRVDHLTGQDRPKALLPLADRPFIDFKLAAIAAAGGRKVVMLVGHGSAPLEDHVGDGARYGLEVQFVHDGTRLLGTGGALRKALPVLGDVFWVTYGDTLLDVPTAAVEAQLAAEPAIEGVMTVLANEDRWETSNVDVDGSRVTAYEKPAVRGRHRFIDYGMSLFRRRAFALAPTEDPFDLGVLVAVLAATGRLGAFEVTERFHDIGTEASWRETDRWCRDTDYWRRLTAAGGITG